MHIEEGAQAGILAVVAAVPLVAGCGGADALDGIEANKRGVPLRVPKADGLQSRADGAGFTAVGMDDDLWRDAGAVKPSQDKVRPEL